MNEKEQAGRVLDTAPAGRQRRPTLANVLTQAKRAGIPVKGAVIELGKITLTFGESEAATDINEWDEVARRDAH
jgi:hypothetical protein